MEECSTEVVCGDGRNDWSLVAQVGGEPPGLYLVRLFGTNTASTEEYSSRMPNQNTVHGGGGDSH